MPTKVYQRFIHRIEAYTEDLELCDLLVQQFRAVSDSPNSIALVFSGSPGRHPTLGRRRNNLSSRKICGNHLKHTLHVAFVKDLYEDFSEFMADTMTKAAQKGVEPKRFVGDAKLDLHAKDILASGDWDQAVRVISDAIFRKLENERSTKQLIEKVSCRLGLKIDAGLLTAAMPYLDARHMLVHQDAKADAAYVSDYPNVKLKNGRIAIDFAFASAAKSAVIALASHIDEKIIAMGLVRQRDMSGQH